MAGDCTSLLFGEPEVLVAAKHLCAGLSVQMVQSSGMTYFHLMFDRHEVILSSGAWTESVEPNNHCLKAVGNAQRLEIFELFPALKAESGSKPARPQRRLLTQKNAEGLSE